jgi:hypothetical protein
MQHRSNPFARAIAMAASIASVMQATAGNYSTQQKELASLGPYVSRGKGGKKPAVSGNGSARVQRNATKRRNVRRNRLAHR